MSLLDAAAPQLEGRESEHGEVRHPREHLGVPEELSSVQLLQDRCSGCYGNASGAEREVRGGEGWPFGDSRQPLEAKRSMNFWKVI